MAHNETEKRALGWPSLRLGRGPAAGAAPNPAQPQPQMAEAPLPGPKPQPAGGQPPMSLSQRGVAMWKNLSPEARTAIGVGVPAALLGGVVGMGGFGGKAIGALGLGAAGAGAAAGGMFGEGAQRFMGRQLYNAGQFFGGNKSDYAGQVGMLSKLPPQIGAAVLMGRDPNLSQQEAMQHYTFLTKNKEMLQRISGNLTRKTAAVAGWRKVHAN